MPTKSYPGLTTQELATHRLLSAVEIVPENTNCKCPALEVSFATLQASHSKLLGSVRDLAVALQSLRYSQDLHGTFGTNSSSHDEIVHGAHWELGAAKSCRRRKKRPRLVSAILASRKHEEELTSWKNYNRFATARLQLARRYYDRLQYSDKTYEMELYKLEVMKRMHFTLSAEIQECQSQLLARLLKIFHLKTVNGSYYIRGFEVLSATEYAARFQTHHSAVASEPWAIDAGLSFSCQCLLLLSKYLNTPLNIAARLSQCSAYVLEDVPVTSCSAFTHLQLEPVESSGQLWSVPQPKRVTVTPPPLLCDLDGRKYHGNDDGCGDRFDAAASGARSEHLRPADPETLISDRIQGGEVLRPAGSESAAAELGSGFTGLLLSFFGRNTTAPSTGNVCSKITTTTGSPQNGNAATSPQQVPQRISCQAGPAPAGEVAGTGAATSIATPSVVIPSIATSARGRFAVPQSRRPGGSTKDTDAFRGGSGATDGGPVVKDAPDPSVSVTSSEQRKSQVGNDDELTVEPIHLEGVPQPDGTRNNAVPLVATTSRDKISAFQTRVVRDEAMDSTACLTPVGECVKNGGGTPDASCGPKRSDPGHQVMCPAASGSGAIVKTKLLNESTERASYANGVNLNNRCRAAVAASSSSEARSFFTSDALEDALFRPFTSDRKQQTVSTESLSGSASAAELLQQPSLSSKPVHIALLPIGAECMTFRCRADSSRGQLVIRRFRSGFSSISAVDGGSTRRVGKNVPVPQPRAEGRAAATSQRPLTLPVSIRGVRVDLPADLVDRIAYLSRCNCVIFSRDLKPVVLRALAVAAAEQRQNLNALVGPATLQQSRSSAIQSTSAKHPPTSDNGRTLESAYVTSDTQAVGAPPATAASTIRAQQQQQLGAFIQANSMPTGSAGAASAAGSTEFLFAAGGTSGTACLESNPATLDNNVASRTLLDTSAAASATVSLESSTPQLGSIVVSAFSFFRFSASAEGLPPSAVNALGIASPAAAARSFSLSPTAESQAAVVDSNTLVQRHLSAGVASSLVGPIFSGGDFLSVRAVPHSTTDRVKFLVAVRRFERAVANFVLALKSQGISASSLPNFERYRRDRRKLFATGEQREEQATVEERNEPFLSPPVAWASIVPTTSPAAVVVNKGRSSHSILAYFDQVGFVTKPPGSASPNDLK